jgi:hypothetical protein
MISSNLKTYTTKVVASDEQTARCVLRKKYPLCKIIAYRFETNFKYIDKRDRNYSNRIMEVLFIKNMDKLWRTKKWN